MYLLDARGAVPALNTATVYNYDKLYRLTAENGPAGDIGYTYDPVGNRLTKIDDSGTTTYAYDRADRITSVVTPVDGLAYVTDANGNLASRGGQTFTYD